MVRRIVSGFVLSLTHELALGLEQGESLGDAVMLLQTQAKVTKHLSLLEKEEAQEYLQEDFEEHDEWEQLDAEQAIAEAAQLPGGFKRCFGGPRGAHSTCKVIGGGVNFARTHKLCAQAAVDIGADTFQFLATRGRCWLKTCGAINLKLSTEGRQRPWKIYSTYCALESVEREIPDSNCGADLSTNYLVFPRPPPDVCGTALRFNHMKANNLNGLGPNGGAKAFRFKEVLPDIDLVVKADENYMPHNSQRNGVFRGRYGRLNMQSGTETFLTFRFVESSGQKSVKVDKFLFTLFDIDHGARCSGQMTVTASKYAAYYLDPDTELIVTTDRGDASKPPSSTFTSTKKGTSKDNPKFPHLLTAAQKARTVTFEYDNVKFFTMGVKMGEGRGGRNILFGGLSSLTEDACPFDGHPYRAAAEN